MVFKITTNYNLLYLITIIILLTKFEQNNILLQKKKKVWTEQPTNR